MYGQSSTAHSASALAPACSCRYAGGRRAPDRRRGSTKEFPTTRPGGASPCPHVRPGALPRNSCRAAE